VKQFDAGINSCAIGQLVFQTGSCSFYHRVQA
jgi:hypothetical protein